MGESESSNSESAPRREKGTGCFTGCGLMALAMFFVVLLMLWQGLCRPSYEDQLRTYMEEAIPGIRKSKNANVSLYGPESLERLLMEPDCLPNVTKAHVSAHGTLADERWEGLTRLPNLREIYIYDSGPTEPFFKRIRGMKSIESITFETYPLPGDTLEHVKSLPNLKHVGFNGYVCKAIVKNLAHFKGHPTLESVMVDTDDLTENLIQGLKEIPKLNAVEFRSRREEELQRLRDALPGVEINGNRPREISEEKPDDGEAEAEGEGGKSVPPPGESPD